VAKRPGSDYDEADIMAKLPDWPTLAGKSKKSVIRKAVGNILKLPPRERKALWQAVKNDIEFYKNLDDPDFEFRYCNLDTQTQAVGNELLLRFYKILGSKAGFAKLPGQKIRLSGAVLEQLYREANKKCAICPACLVDRLPGPIMGISQNDREHYFPQSKYPPLAVHPFNLTIACMKCNQRRHSNIDPINDHKAGALLDTFLPYTRPGLNQIELRFTITDSKKMVTLLGKPGEARAKQRAENFERMYRLSGYWSDYLEGIDATLRDHVLFKLKSPTLAGTKKILQGLVDFEELTKTSEPQAFLRAKYLAWILNEHLDSWFEELKEKR
jgi:hypothetical protein